MTFAQADRLRDIVRQIRRAPSHPSPNVRAAFAGVTAEDCEVAALKVEEALATDSGQMAHMIIDAYYKPGSERNVVELFRPKVKTPITQ